MGTPLPLEGTNPYTGMYQSRQFGVGHLSATPNYVADYLADPPDAMVTAQEQTPLVEQAEFWGLQVQIVTVTGAPASGTFVLQYGVNFTSALAYNAAAATVQTALQGLTSIGSGQATVSGSAGGPWTVTLGSNFNNVPVQLIKVRSTNFTGGTKPNVVVNSTAQQAGFSPF